MGEDRREERETMSGVARTGAADPKLVQGGAVDPRLPERPSQAPHKGGDGLDELDKIATELQEAAMNLYPKVEASFRLDRELGVIVVTILDGQSHKVLRQIPHDEALRLARLLRAGRQRLLDRLL
jgi:uncharacterized FlaG/YvyC family protein